MSYLIGATSTKHDRAIRFGKELDRAMKARGVGRRVVAQAIHGSDTSVMYWRTGRMLPRPDTARKLAEVLDWPSLLTLARSLRTKRCTVDDIAFVDESGSDNRIYCSPGCQRVAEKLRVGTPSTKRAAVAERRVIMFERAVAGFCGACEPEGVCFAADCELRPVSPLPLVEDRAGLARAERRPQEAVLALIEGRDPLAAVRRERSQIRLAQGHVRDDEFMADLPAAGWT